MPRMLPSPLGFPFIYKTGLYYGPPLMGVTGNGATTQNRLTWMPLYFSRPTTLDRIGIEVTTLANPSTVRLGLHADDGSGNPGVLILDAGTVDSTSTGVKEITISQYVSGLVWLAAVAQAGIPTVKTLGANENLAVGGPLANVMSGGVGGYVQNGVTGALPDPAVPTGGLTSAILVGVRIA